MIVDRTHVRWGLVAAVATVAAAWIYLAKNNPEELRRWHLAIALPAWLGPSPPLRGNVGATPLGLIYGTMALLIFIFAALLGWRRNHPTWKVGRIQVWLKAHIWLTIFTIPLVLFHCGFHGGGPMTQFLLGLYAFVMVSGFWGLALQHVIPKMMSDYLPEEVVFEQIPFIRSQLVIKGEAIREDLAGQSEEATSEPNSGQTAIMEAGDLTAIKTTLHFIDQATLPYLKRTNSGRSLLREKRASDDQFRLMKLRVPEFLHAPLGIIQGLCDEKRRLDLQARLHYWLHGWIIVHASASILLVVLTVVHAIVAAFIYA